MKILFKIYLRTGTKFIITEEDFYEKPSTDDLSNILDHLHDAISGKLTLTSLYIGKWQFKPEDISVIMADF